MTTLRAGRTRNLDLCPGRCKKFVFNETSVSAVGHTASEADYSPLVFEIKNAWSCTSIASCLQTWYTCTVFLPDKCKPTDWFKESVSIWHDNIKIYLRGEDCEVRIVIGFVIRSLLVYSVTQRRLVVRYGSFGMKYRSHVWGSSSSLIPGTLQRSAALNTVMRGWEFVYGPVECQLLKVCFIIRVVGSNGL